MFTEQQKREIADANQRDTNELLSALGFYAFAIASTFAGICVLHWFLR